MAKFSFYISTEECKKETTETLRYSWALCAKSTIVYFLFCLISISATVFPSIFVKWWLAFPLSLVSIIFLSLFNYGYSAFCLKVAQQKTAKISDIFCGFSKKAGSIISVALKKIFLLIFWLVLLIFPMFIKALSYSMTNFLMVDRKDINAANAIKESNHIMMQNKARYLKFWFSFCGWFALGVLSFGIGFFWILPMYGVNRAMFYENLKTAF